MDNSRTHYAVKVEEDTAEAPAEAVSPEMMPVPVSVGHPVKTWQQSAQFGHFFTFVIPPGSASATQILPEDPDRLRAVLQVNGSSVVLCNSQSAAQAPGNLSASSTASTEVTPSNPAAGASYVYTNTTGAPQQVTSLNATFTASATVANRYINVIVKDAAGNMLWSANNTNAVVASGFIVYDGYIGATQQNSGAGDWIFPLPTTGGLIPAGGTLTIGGIANAGDQIGAVVLAFSSAATGLPAAPAGFLVAKGTSPAALASQSPVWAVNTDPSTTALVSVCVERVNP